LIELATHRPDSPRAMRENPRRVGDTKPERYGTVFLDAYPEPRLIAAGRRNLSIAHVLAPVFLCDALR
jgi:hypothetical protein